MLLVTFPLLKNTLTNAIQIITTHHQKNTPHYVAGYPPLTSPHPTTLWVTYPLQNSMLSYRVAGYLPTTKEHANQRNTDYNHAPPEEHAPPRCELPPPNHHAPPHVAGCEARDIRENRKIKGACLMFDRGLLHYNR